MLDVDCDWVDWRVDRRDGLEIGQCEAAVGVLVVAVCSKSDDVRGTGARGNSLCDCDGGIGRGSPMGGRQGRVITGDGDG